MVSSLVDPLLGHLIDGRYEVLSRIARGGMATVYLARDRRLDREVAIKVMHPHLAEGASGSEFIARFRREARAAAQLTHPGLVGVFDQGVDGETSYLTMEYVEGTNLRRHLNEHGSLSVAQALSTAEAVLDALAAAHRKEMVHRDIKPENVLLAADGRIKVADFGLARAVTEVTSTTAGTILGTVAYLAPELVLNGTGDARSDVYAVGILLYEMLTGSQPFSGSTPIQVAYQHAHNDVPAPSDTVGWLPAEVDELVTALAAREPAERPTDASAALDLVRRTVAALDEATLERRAEVVPVLRTADPGPDPDATESLHLPRRDGAPEAPAPDETDGRGHTMALPLGAGTLAPTLPAGPTATAAAHLRLRWRRVAWVLLAVAALGGGSWWYLWLGPGAYTTVPGGLLGAEQTVAEQVLTTAGLDPDLVLDFDPEVPAGLVVITDPAPGERVRKEGTVTVTVSQGPDLRDIPTGLAGAPVQDVVAALVAAGMDVPEPLHDYSDQVASGAVIGISVPEGSQQPVGTTVVVTVSDGPAPVKVSSVIGAALGDAKAQLESQGLKVVEGPPDFSTQFPAGTVMAQDPAPDADAHRTDTVTLTISQGPPLVEMPQVVGMQFDEAKAQLEALGLVVEKENVLGGFFGTVRSQSVDRGDQVPQGTVVVLRVV